MDTYTITVKVDALGGIIESAITYLETSDLDEALMAYENVRRKGRAPNLRRASDGLDYNRSTGTWM